MATHTLHKPPQYTGIHPSRFMMWLYIGTIVMIFAAFTSALLVSRADNILNNSWTRFVMPETFTVSTVIIVLSSLTLQWAFFAARKDQFSRVNIGISLTMVLGILFLMTQFIGYQKLVKMDIFLVDPNSVSGSFLYVITGVHGLHLVAGLIALLVMAIKALRYRIHSGNLVGFEMTVTFWHALGLLWIYLFVFLSMIYS